MNFPIDVQQHARNRKNLFVSYHLAYRTRLKVLQKVASFDFNHEGMIEDSQILQVLSYFLTPSSSVQKIQSIYSNLLKQSGKNIRYEKLVQLVLAQVSVCLQQYLYTTTINICDLRASSSGSKQINDKDFIQILGSLFSTIGLQVESAEVKQLFDQIKANKTRIPVGSFFDFIKSYFGSQCIAGEKTIEPRKTNNIATQIKYNEAIQRIAKIIYPQLKNLICGLDTCQSLCFKNSAQLQKVQQFFTIKFQEIREYGYSQVINKVVEQKFIKAEQNWKKLDKNQFIREFLSNLIHFIKVKPSVYLLEEIFQHLSQGHSQIKTKYYNQFLINLGQVLKR